MRHEIAHAPAFATVEFECATGEAITAQPGCMLAMTPGFEVTAAFGSQMSGKATVGRSMRSLLAGESFFTAVYTAKRDGERLTLAPSHPGEVRGLDVDDSRPLMLASGAFLGCGPEIKLELKYVGVRGFLTTGGMFLMRTIGTGVVFVSSHGALVERVLEEGERYVIDNRFIVAFAESVTCEMVKVSRSLRHSFFSGEGVVNRYIGPGRVLYQTRASASRGLIRGLAELVT